MFTLMDLVMPIGVGVFVAAICLWGVIKAKEKKAKVISAITGLIFLAAIPAWYGVRASALQPDYTSGDGIEVVRGKVNLCPKVEIEKWSKWLINFWSEHYDARKVRGALKGKLLICHDDEVMSSWGKLVRGVTHGRTSVIGMQIDNPDYTESLFYHELSHQIVDRFVPYIDGTIHHPLFKEKKLGH